MNTSPSHGRDDSHSPGHRFRQLMDQTCVPIPGAFCALAARAIRDAGFQACYISGAATTVCAGVPDIGVLTLDHFSRTIRESADASGLVVFADADTGFGEAEMVRRTVIEYSRAGAAGFHIEDQKFPKRCGHLDGKELIPTDHMIEKVMWAAKARDEIGDGFVVCARTDAKGVDGFDAALDRAAAYTRAGADMIFPEGLASEKEFELFAKAMRNVPCAGRGGEQGPYLLANMTEFGKTPMIEINRFASWGYHCVIYPVTLLRVAMGAVTKALEVLRTQGTAESLLNQMQTRQQLYGLVEYTPGTPWEFPIR